MGKQSKKTSVVAESSRSRQNPYPKKPRVDVVYEGAPPPAISRNQPNPNTTSKASSAAIPTTSSSKGHGKGKSKASSSASVPILPPTIGQEAETATASPTLPLPLPLPTFKIIAGTYEKLLYGLEGTFTPPVTTLDDASTSHSNLSADFQINLTPIFIFPGHLACVKAVSASQGGKWLATGSEDEFVKVWDLRRRKEVGSLSEHTGSITCITFPTPSHLLASSEDSTISLFRTSDWSLLKSLKGHSGRVNHIDVHPTGRVALSVGKDSTLKMWDLMRGRGAASLGLGSEAELVKFSPLGTHFAVLFPKKIQIYSLTLKLLHTLTTQSRFNTVLFATIPSESEVEDEEKEVLCVGTEKGEIEIYGVTVGTADEDAAEENDEDDKGEKEGEDLGSGADVIRMGTLVGHANRIKQISALPFYIPSAKEPRKTTLLTSVSSDGYINLYDLSAVLSETSSTEVQGKGRVVEPLTQYDTKGSRLTCVVLADGGVAKPQTQVKTTNGVEAAAGGKGKGKEVRNGAKGGVNEKETVVRVELADDHVQEGVVEEDDDDEEEEDDEEEDGEEDDLYDEEGNEDGEEGNGMEVEFEDEDEDEEEEEMEEEGEGEYE